MFEHGSWMLPAAEKAYEHRKEIQSVWKKISDRLFGEKRNVVFTGAAGVGKTVLLDHLTGKAFELGYHPPDQSQKEEKGGITGFGKRIKLLTVPGQDSGPRYEAFNRLVLEESPVDGVIHVVANGFPTIRNDHSKEILVRDQKIETISAYRDMQAGAELDDLRRTCDFIRQSHQRHHRPAWLIVAVAKIDLYYGEIDEARIKYSPLGKSEITQMLNDLRDAVGRDFLRWDAAPVCTWLENFTWNGETVKCELLPDQRDHYVASFAKKLQTFC